uniref:Uncharacterized protein n=1 Tax=Meloidogyne enterolobii TaxID=390850 RepID=A0A6V7VS47_MELEN|nr:unnamed protein product [Meloidogyne enterolobii]
MAARNFGRASSKRYFCQTTVFCPYHVNNGAAMETLLNIFSTHTYM